MALEFQVCRLMIILKQPNYGYGHNVVIIKELLNFEHGKPWESPTTCLIVKIAF